MLAPKSAKRPLTGSDTSERALKRQRAEGEVHVPFGGQERDVFLQTRVHKKLHAQAASLSDVDLEEIGLASFNQQFSMLEAKLQANGGAGGLKRPTSTLFGGLSREEYVSARIHRRLHPTAAELDDQKLHELGQLSFNQQFTTIESGSLGQQQAAADWAYSRGSSDTFGGLSREAYMQQRVHRKLHGKAATVSDHELLEMGKLNFNEQFSAFEQFADIGGAIGGGPLDQGPRPLANSARSPHSGGRSDIFGGLDRDVYMNARVHRKLHPRAAGISDGDLDELGKLSFNDQFGALEQMASSTCHAKGSGKPASVLTRLEQGELFGGNDRETFIQQRVHRKLHEQARTLGDQDLSDLGQMKFNDQFGAVERMCAAPSPQRSAPPGKGAAPTSKGYKGSAPTSKGSGNLFAEHGGRDGFMQQRVHRRLHNAAASLNDQDLLHLGKLTFNDQFPFIEQLTSTPQRKSSQAPASDIFGGAGREQFKAEHVHRRLHSLADALSDEELLELGKLKFNAQFPIFNMDPDQATPADDLFKGLSRDEYMMQRVHRKLHSHARDLSDESLHELGKLSFNEQFPMLGLDESSAASQDQGRNNRADLHKPGDMFGGLSREEFTQQRVHRKLHGYAEALRDEDLADFGRRKFNDQFEMLEQLAAPTQAPQRRVQGGGAFGGQSRDEFMQLRVHRRLHSKAASMSDAELLEVGQLKFNDQFHMFEQFEDMAKSEGFSLHASNAFGGLSRDEYMIKRVHRRLHPQAAGLSDEELLDLGQRSFNEQFPVIEQMSGGGASHQDGSGIFGSSGRDRYVTQCIHRKLHAQLVDLSDQEVFDLGKLSFNEQCTSMGHPPR